MDKTRVNYAIGHRCSAAQAFEVFKIASMHLCTSRNKRLGTRIRASKTEHLMPCVDQLPDNSGTYEACGPCNEYAHMFPPCTGFRVPYLKEPALTSLTASDKVERVSA